MGDYGASPGNVSKVKSLVTAFALTNSTTATEVTAYTTRKNMFRAGSEVWLRAIGVISSHSTAGTLTSELLIGSTSGASTGAVTLTNSLSAVGLTIEAGFVIVTAGATGTAIPWLAIVSDDATLHYVKSTATAVTFATTAENDINLRFTFGTASASNALTIMTCCWYVAP